MLQQIIIHVWQDVANDIVNVPVRWVVITSKVMHDKACVHIVMEEAGKERCRLVQMDFSLCGPVRVGCFDPLEVVIGEGCDGLL